jgi:xanthine dehydrogenase small subunit
MKNGLIDEIRVAAASLAPFPARLAKTEKALAGKAPGADVIQAARHALLAEAQPIDDIRSNAQYRKVVGANLLEEFLHSLCQESETG